MSHCIQYFISHLTAMVEALTTDQNGSWRIKTNQELHKIIKYRDTINFARTQRLGWVGHIERMQESRMVKAIHAWKPISKRPTGSQRHSGRMMLKRFGFTLFTGHEDALGE
jgi:hypothetical protein